MPKSQTEMRFRYKWLQALRGKSATHLPIRNTWLLLTRPKQSGNECYVEDPDTGRTVPRAYVQRLEEHAQKLREALKKLSSDPPPKDASTPVNHPERKRQNPPVSNRRYLGTSSGIAFIEYAITFAKTRHILDGSRGLASQPNSQAHTDSKRLIDILSPTPAHANLDRETVSRLFDYFSVTQWFYRILTREQFDFHLSRFFSDTPNEYPESGIVIHAISAISTFYLGAMEGNAMASNLAEMQYERALHLLPNILPYRTIGTLQIILLVLLYSLVNPQKSVTWHLLGAALRLATFLRLHEDNLTPAATDSAKDASARRDLFWSLYSIDRAVGNTLGRPTALQDVDIRTPFPEITPASLHDSSSALNAAAANHCFLLRRLQSEAADVLYQKTRPMPADWHNNIQRRLDAWLVEAPLSQSSPQMEDWINHAYHNLTMFIYRPSLISSSSFEGAYQRSFASASNVLKLYAKMHSRNAIDCTWMAFHWLFLAAVTHLFCIWTSPEIRAIADWKEINEDLQRTRMVLSAMAEHWRYGKKILDIYCQLCEGTIRLFVQLIPITGIEQDHDQQATGQVSWPGNSAREAGIDAAFPAPLPMHASIDQTSTFQFDDTLMNDDLGHWLDQPIIGDGTENGAAMLYSNLDSMGNELDPWFYRM
ncbi:hypothetical protein A1O1_07591 [Capronia coronata CBS 617.96]|uniref:Xylanolytic transcriptional activator regulatory domain-containing protein n=1 Tax=Capronia coronata CBS 617.96 TaxID=1182541 RepID=W9XLX4_9EURO|nr:uncharacterized protein A1O1_07591 [Capronia coronata CBS 617.96]EXJ81527.1 hypothetical protein A1O1_07591 [Capronia coronata CBS 617.96]